MINYLLVLYLVLCQQISLHVYHMYNICICKFFDISDGYTSIHKYEASYKSHKTGYLWWSCNYKCLSEGAQLFYPNDRTEAEFIFDFINNATVKYIRIGIQNYFKEGFTTIDGKLMRIL
jgi:hypothetical protein